MLDLVSSLSSAIPGVEQEAPEFPFIPDQREDAIICCGDDEGSAPSSTLLVGRSGTGKVSRVKSPSAGPRLEYFSLMRCWLMADVHSTWEALEAV